MKSEKILGSFPELQKEEDAFSAVIIAINIIICYTANNIIYYIYDFNSIESHLQEWFCLW